LREIMLASKAMLVNPTAPALQGVQAPTPSPSNIRLRACLSFFRSVIQSGESWTPTCDAMYTQAVDDTPLETRSGLADSARSDETKAPQEGQP
jgi:hypothetical protein